MKTATWHATSVLLIAAATLVACDEGTTSPQAPSEAQHVSAPLSAAKGAPIQVSGTAVHYFSTAIVHSQQPVTDGMIQRSTDIVQLSGDMDGYVVYHVTSDFDFAAGTLVNTGTQIFSGTVAGSKPLILHDDSFRFDIDLATGATTGVARLSRSGDAPHKGGWYECDLSIVVTGVTPEGDNLSDYTGTCTRYGNI
jgi:hypothetical protein